LCRAHARSDALALPPFLAKYADDALWALMVFLGIAVVLPVQSTEAVADLAIAVSCAVESGQLYHAPWLDAVRRTTLGHLVLGDTFAWGDIADYLVGIGAGATAEWAIEHVSWHWRGRCEQGTQSTIKRGPE
jgi:threonine/homoserine efflux transporter RhtA